MKLHTYTLLRDSFRLEERMESVRTMVARPPLERRQPSRAAHAKGVDENEHPVSQRD